MLNRLLNFLIFQFMFMTEEGDGGSLLGGSGGGNVDPNVDPNPTGGDPNTTEFDGPAWAKDMELESDLLQDPVLKNVNDIPTLVKNYVHAQRTIGKKGTILPDENASEETWNELYNQLGRPESADKYDLGELGSLQEDFVKEFAEQAHKAGLTAKQAKQIMGYYNEAAGKESEQEIQQRQADVDNAIGELKQEWGEAFDTQIHKAQVALKQFGGEEMMTYLNETGLGNDVRLIKLFAKVGESLREDTFAPEAVASFRIKPEDAKQEINDILNSSDHPYWNPSHADHGAAKKRMEELYKITS